jgi:hypothetical protein
MNELIRLKINRISGKLSNMFVYEDGKVEIRQVFLF